ncbi:MAG: glycosyltransferase family 4 protein [Acidobacteriota bacterium]
MNEKILHLRSSGGLYGAEQVILNLALELNNLGCTNHVVCFNHIKSPHLELVTEAREHKLSAFAVDCRGLFDLQTVKSIRRLMKDHDIDVIHCHDYKTRVFGLCATSGLQAAKIATNHLWTRANLTLRAYEAIDGILFNGFDRVVAVSELIETECRPFMLRKDRLSCIPNGIDQRRFTLDNREKQRSLTRAQLGLQDSDLVLGNIARLSIEKDQATLLHAFKRLTGLVKERSCKLLMVGDGPEEENLRKLARELEVSDRCLFLGVRTDIPQILNCLDVYVQSSTREGLPIAVLEAMASGTAIVSTKAGGIPKVIADGEQGRLVEIGDAGQLAAVLNEVLGNADERRRLAEQARQLVAVRFSARAMAERYLELYRSVAAHRSN